MQEMWVLIPGLGKSLEEDMATCRVFLPGNSHRQREPGSPWACKRIGYNWATKHHRHHRHSEFCKPLGSVDDTCGAISWVPWTDWSHKPGRRLAGQRKSWLQRSERQSQPTGQRFGHILWAKWSKGESCPICWHCPSFPQSEKFLFKQNHPINSTPFV